MTTFGTSNVHDTTVAESVWKLWSDGSAFNDVNMNTHAIDFVIGTGEGFVCGYDTGGFKITAEATAGSGVFWNSGVYYCRTTATQIGNDVNRQTAWRIYAPSTGIHYLHPFASGTTGYSFLYLDDSGTLYDATGNSWVDGDAVTSIRNKVLLARIIRDGNNTITQSDIIDRRTFPREPFSRKMTIIKTVPGIDGEFQPNTAGTDWSVNVYSSPAAIVTRFNSSGECGYMMPIIPPDLSHLVPNFNYNKVELKKVEVYGGHENMTNLVWFAVKRIHDITATNLITSTLFGYTNPIGTDSQLLSVSNETKTWTVVPTGAYFGENVVLALTNYYAGVGNDRIGMKANDRLYVFAAKFTFEVEL